MVQLKSSPPQRDNLFVASFQFHNGSIKMENTRRFADVVAAFQFHNGSIKIIKDTPLYIRVVEFQFHNGSIKIAESILL
jgi:hypothetical protein